MAETERDMLATQPAPHPGAIGPYRILKELGKGGMGVVYLASDPSLDRKVVIKVLHSYLADDPVFLKRFMQEADHAASVNHPSVIRIFDIARQAKPPYIVMECFQGEPLDRLVASRGPLPPTTALLVARNVALGLREATRLGLVHRDVKPSNILVDDEGFVKLLDFGIAKSVERDPKLTGTGELLGTPYFMAPETLRGEAADFRSDMYSLGVTLFYVFTGSYPYAGRNVAELAVKLHTEKQPDPRDVRPSVPDACAALIRQLMAAIPDQRYPDYDALIRSVDRARRDEPTAHGRRSRWVPAFAAGILLASGVATIYYTQRAGTVSQQAHAPEVRSPQPPVPQAPPAAQSSPLSVPPEVPPGEDWIAHAGLGYDFSTPSQLDDWLFLGGGRMQRDSFDVAWAWSPGRLVSNPRSRMVLQRVLRGDTAVGLEFELADLPGSLIAVTLFERPERVGGYVFEVDSTTAYIRRLVEHGIVTLGSAPLPSAANRRLVRIEATGAQLRLLVDERPVVTVEDTKLREGELSVSAPRGRVYVYRVVIEADVVARGPLPRRLGGQPPARPGRPTEPHAPRMGPTAAERHDADL